ncbi:MAG: MHYT domain-containing protein [Xenococcaceae cyanobacterium]
MELRTSYNLPLVSFSVFIAILAAYTALELTERISAKGKIKISWLIGSSLTMGTGIWSMHFIGMLAYSIVVPITYDVTTVVISWIPAVIASGVAFYYLHRGLDGIYLLWAGTLMGVGIGAMHYIGMAAMRVNAQMQYDYFVVALSVVFAVILSSISLATANYVKGFLDREELKLGGSFLMGAAISGLHYIGMAAVSFTVAAERSTLSLNSENSLNIETTSLGYTIGIVTILIIGGAFMACMKAQKKDLQHLSHQLQKSSKILTRVNQELEKRVANRTAELLKAKEAAEQQNIQLKKAKADLEEASKSKDIFLANISHELRTPLNSILGYTRMLQKDVNLTSSQVRDLRIVRHSGTHLLTLINDILDLSKTTSAKLELNPTTIHLPHFLKGIIGIAQMWAKEKKLLLHLKTHKALPVHIQADETRLRQILINLLSNAVKFTTSGEVILRVSILDNTKESTQKSNRRELRFEVSDTGIGMNSEQLNKLFRPFEQFGDVESRSAGTGLGLSLSKQLVTLMGSELKVKSKLNSGSTFWFDVVLLVVEVPSFLPKEKTEKILNYEGKRRKILIVDDKKENRDLLVKILKPIGFETETANNGQDMLSNLFSVQPDLILLDLFMPGQTGFTAVKELRKIPEFKNTPVIVISASSIAQEMKKYLECDAYFNKPIDEEELLNALQKYLNLKWIYNKAS